MTPPTWNDVVTREYEAWDRERIVIDTARASMEDSLAALRCKLKT